MVSKLTLQHYGWESIELYFEYILESKINGQFTQAKNLIDKLSRVQKKELLKHFIIDPDYLPINDTDNYMKDKQYVINCVIESL